MSSAVYNDCSTSPSAPYEAGAIIIPILQDSESKFLKVKWFTGKANSDLGLGIYYYYTQLDQELYNSTYSFHYYLLKENYLLRFCSTLKKSEIAVLF